MRRPPGLWILLSAGVLWLSLQDVYGIRATALIFGKASTTTTSTEVPATDPAKKDEGISSSTEATGDGQNVTKPPLTGNPQIDYIWDPNLPKELNGHNLSDYPFYERVPDEPIEFKCDGLHDGFYASIPHKCQVYHHCLFGTRYDFLCANYTAFDQKTFICHFASEVDCANSKKYWHRNDDLYQAASTTTVKPLVIPTTPPPTGPLTVSPLFGGGFRRPNGKRGNRYRPRQRPHYDYYEDDEYYDEEYYERPRRKKRPRPRRPAYEEEEYPEEYEDRFERRGSGRRDESRKRPYDRRDEDDEEPPRKRPLGRKNKDRRKPEYEDEEDTKPMRRDEETSSKRRDNDDRKTDDDQSNRKYEKRRPHTSETSDDERPSSSSSSKRRNEDDETDKRPKFEKRRPHPESTKSRTSDDEIKESRPSKRRQENDEEEAPRKPSRKSSRRPYKEYDEEAYDDRDYDRPRKSERTTTAPKEDNNRAVIKPVSGTIYDRPRLAPRIKLPVPKNEAEKYAYKHVAIATKPPVLEEEYYDDYEEEEPKAKPSRKTPEVSERPVKHSSTYKEDTKKSSRTRDAVELNNRDDIKKNSRPRDIIEPIEDEKPTTKRGKYASRPATRHSTTTPKKPVEPLEYYDEDYIEEPVKPIKPKIKPKPTTTSTSTTTTTTTTTSTTTEKPAEHVVRVVKRPFLPSRGGNPYSGRGLQPVGLRAQPQEEYDTIKTEDVKTKEPTYSMKESFSSSYKKNDEFKPSPAVIKVPVSVRQKYVEDEYTQQATGPRTTQKPKIPERNPLDLNEYDVTLNDALNPTLPNLPVRGFPTGFSAAQDYSYSSFQRPRYVVDPALTQANTNYYQPKLIRPTRFEGQANTDIPNANLEYQGFTGQNYRPRQQQQTQAFYF